jgi:DNA polymerase
MMTAKFVNMDFETRSLNTITEGAYRYAEASEPVLCMYALNDGEVKVWNCLTERMPEDLHDYLSDSSYTLVFHNVEFDRTNMLAWGWGEDYDLNPRRFLCTMTWARMCRLPGGLDDLCKVLGIPETYAKKSGAALIKMFCIPKPDGTFTQPADQPAKWAEFVQYGIYDILAMRECARRMPQIFSAAERELYARTVEMNDRGIGVDRELATKAMEQAASLKARYKKEGGALAAKAEEDRWGSADEVQAAGQVSIMSQKAVLDFIASYGIKLEDARSATLEKFLDSAQADLLPMEARSLLATRLKANKASVAKYSSVLKGCSSDGRIRGLINFYGAGTGRDAGRRFQPQNLARPAMLGKNLSMEDAVKIVKAGTAEFYFEEPMQLLSDTVRGVLVPGQGNKFCAADLSSIEGRVLPWLAQEDWMVQYFRDLDTGKVKYDGYELAYATAFGVDPNTVTKAQRTLGKPIDLACGYGGGTGALITFATLYRIDIDNMALLAREAADPALWFECENKHEWYEEKGMTNGLSKATWTGCQYIIQSWRNKRALTKALWTNCETAFENAINNPGVNFEMANKTYAVNVDGWVFVVLPSGRSLVYPQAHIADRGGRKQLAFMGVNPFTRKWGQIYTYGGKLTENIDQAVARDCFFWNIPQIEAAGYSFVCRVHDEAITEVPDRPEYSGHALAKLMSTPQSWCHDLPLNAVGEDLTRYQK